MFQSTSHPYISIEGDVGVNTNYLSQAPNSVISSSLAIRFTEDVVIPRNRATDAPVSIAGYRR